MKTAARSIAIAAILAGAAIAIHRWCWIPYRLNIVKKTVEQRTFKAFDSVQVESAVIVARNNIDALARAGGDCGRDVDVCMEIAANERILGRWREAIAAYERALRLSKRPEVYYNLAMTELRAGDRETAIEHLVCAVRFDPEVGYIPDPEINAEVHRRAYLASRAAAR